MIKQKIDYTPKQPSTKYKRFGKGPAPAGTVACTAVVQGSLVRENNTVRSVVTPGGSTALKPVQYYSGDAMLGVSQLHKSNAIPVFRTQDIIDISKMRR